MSKYITRIPKKTQFSSPRGVSFPSLKGLPVAARPRLGAEGPRYLGFTPDLALPRASKSP